MNSVELGNSWIILSPRGFNNESAIIERTKLWKGKRGLNRHAVMIISINGDAGFSSRAVGNITKSCGFRNFDPSHFGVRRTPRKTFIRPTLEGTLTEKPMNKPQLGWKSMSSPRQLHFAPCFSDTPTRQYLFTVPNAGYLFLLINSRSALSLINRAPHKMATA